MSMAKLNEHPATRETGALYRGRALVVRLRGRYLEVWEKGRRDRLQVDYHALYEFAAKLRWKTERQRRLEL